jgi:hypothetical protein
MAANRNGGCGCNGGDAYLARARGRCRCGHTVGFEQLLDQHDLGEASSCAPGWHDTDSECDDSPYFWDRFENADDQS